ncbi:MAG TPA: hypothetical protein VM389_11080 [Phycisphaerae bacterium]|nr:hypothetical protein [Phycisphaerae bacterium]HUU23065.1 hypothetical protein [Phycisphaerae bacterium]
MVGLLATMTGALLVVWSVASPLGLQDADNQADRAGRFPGVSFPQRDIQLLLGKMAGNPLIRPGQALPAVKDSGLAQALLKRLTFHGTVTMGGEEVAYVVVEGEPSARQVRSGDRLLDFLVEDIRSGQMTLSLEGVRAVVRH